MLVLTSMSKDNAYIPPEWSTGTDAEIVRALEMHYANQIDLTKIWSIGDVRVVKLNAMSDTYVGETHDSQYVQLALSHVGGKTLADGTTECVFQVDQLSPLSEQGYIDTVNTNISWGNCKRRSWCNEVYYNAIPSTLREIFKQFIVDYGDDINSTQTTLKHCTDYFSLRSISEIDYEEAYSVSSGTNGWRLDEGNQIELYDDDSINRNKHDNCWSRSINANSSVSSVFWGTYYFDSRRPGRGLNPNTLHGIAPFGCI